MNKKIVIHVGPPKTGSSALQNWFVKNHDFLKEKGVFYPKHKISPLGISSGNSTCVLGFDDLGKSIFEYNKFYTLVKQFYNNEYNTLLLSSEYFFYQVDNFLESKKFLESELGIALNLVFVTYIRPEFEFIESIYNQSIKRNGNSKKFPRKTLLPSRELNRLISYIESLGVQYFSLRAYGSNNFFEHSIVDDFLDELDIDFVKGAESTPVINSSYSFQCLEFKRWINKYCGTLFDNQLDLMLQDCEWGDKSYSLLPLGLYDSYKRQSLNKIKEINEICKIKNIERLYSYIELSERKEYKHQSLQEAHFDKIMSFLVERGAAFLDDIAIHISKQPELKDDPYIKRFSTFL